MLSFIHSSYDLIEKRIRFEKKWIVLELIVFHRFYFKESPSVPSSFLEKLSPEEGLKSY